MPSIGVGIQITERSFSLVLSIKRDSKSREGFIQKWDEDSFGLKVVGKKLEGQK